MASTPPPEVDDPSGLEEVQVDCGKVDDPSGLEEVQVDCGKVDDPSGLVEVQVDGGAAASAKGTHADREAMDRELDDWVTEAAKMRRRTCLGFTFQTLTQLPIAAAYFYFGTSAFEHERKQCEESPSSTPVTLFTYYLVNGVVSALISVLTVCLMTAIVQGTVSNDHIRLLFYKKKSAETGESFGYSLGDIAAEVKKQYRYDMSKSLGKLAEPLQKSQEIYSEAFTWVKEVQDKDGKLSALMQMPQEFSYGGNLMTPEQAEGKSKDEPEQPVNDLEVLIGDANHAQKQLKIKICTTDVVACSAAQEWIDAQEIDKSIWCSRADTKEESYRTAVDLVQYTPPAPRFQIVDFIDEALDPGTKGEARIKQKAKYKYPDRYGAPKYCRVRDIARIALIYDTPASLLAGIEGVKTLFKVLQCENRFAYPTALGWRDVTLLVEFSVNDQRKHIAEIQFHLKALALAREKAHKYYRDIRETLQDPTFCEVKPADVDGVQHLILDLLSTDMGDVYGSKVMGKTMCLVLCMTLPLCSICCISLFGIVWVIIGIVAFANSDAVDCDETSSPFWWFFLAANITAVATNIVQSRVKKKNANMPWMDEQAP